MVVGELKLNPVGPENTDLLEVFLLQAGDSLSTFRYFSSRPLSVIGNHLVTVVATIDGTAVGYGHLDKDYGTIWLGIAVTSTMRGKGIGYTIMQYLVSTAQAMKLKEVYLAVDRDNDSAISLYKKFGFMEAGDLNERSMKMVLNIYRAGDIRK